MSPIKDLFLSYEAVNAERVFSEGDILTGTLSLTLSKDTRVKAIFVKVKGDARVKWTEGSGEDSTTYSAHIRYFKLKEYLLAENGKGTALSKGVHLFKFTFQIPYGDMPSSFKGKHGSIVYMLEAKVKKSWRWPSKAQAEFNLVSNVLRYFGLTAMCPQGGSVKKTMGVFSKRVVQLHAVMNRKVCSPGDSFSVVATIRNPSSKTIKPKCGLYQEIVYRVKGSNKTCVERLCRIVGDAIMPNSDETVIWQMNVPPNAIYTMSNCDIISVIYYVKAYLDISFAFDPEVVLPLVVIPATFAQLEPDGGTQGGSVRFLFPPTLHLLLLLYQLHTVDVEESLKSLPVIAIVMVKNLLFVCSLAVAIFTTALGFKIQNKHVGKCLQVQEGTWGGRVSLGECSPYSPMQEWLWIPESQALSSHHTGECLTAPEGEYEGVHLQPCMFKMDSDETGDRVAAVDVDSEEGRQTWSCSKKGLLTLTGRGLHLSASPQSTLVFVSRDHKQGSRWRTLDNQTLCNLRDHKHHQSQDQSHHYIGKSPEARIFPSSTADLHKEAEPCKDLRVL
ncbi:hypothetical protein JOB18_011376 [Solea senegalensis]|uniref:Arrestin C-terminal-like domain-containing protein n=1 Tax=Solea senegalensis TaxID=28829 RepID=A0AAV6QH84_SOLSE|nr:hypothetical protein JOB18_011376 [Solea senegalensis]